MSTNTEREEREINQANESGRPSGVFVHGLWLLAGSWDAWRQFFEERGFATLAPHWPDDPSTVAEARQHPEVFAGKSVGQIRSPTTTRTSSGSCTANPSSSGTPSVG